MSDPMESVFLAAGRALLQAHRFERNLKGLASLVHSIHTADKPSEPVSFSKLSIGPLLDSIRTLIDFDGHLPELLELARTRRNALCHSYFEDRKTELASVEGRQWVIRDLEESQKLFDDAADFCSGALGLLTAHLEEKLNQ